MKWYFDKSSNKQYRMRKDWEKITKGRLTYGNARWPFLYSSSIRESIVEILFASHWKKSCWKWNHASFLLSPPFDFPFLVQFCFTSSQLEEICSIVSQQMQISAIQWVYSIWDYWLDWAPYCQIGPKWFRLSWSDPDLNRYDFLQI